MLLLLECISYDCYDLFSRPRSLKWTFGWVAIFAGALVPFVILFVPEHAFDREAALAREESKMQPPGSSDDSKSRRHSSATVERGEWYASHVTKGWGPFWSQLRLFTGRKSNENPFKILLRPFPLMAHPAVLWGSFTQGTLICFLVALSAVIAEIFGGPPHFFSVTKVGFFFVGPFVGGVIGFIVGTHPTPPFSSYLLINLCIAGILSDWLCKIMTVANHRVFEPEVRIVLVIFQLVSSAIGLFTFGYSIDQNWSYYWSIVLYGFVTFALIMGATATGTYIIDAHLAMSVEAFLCITLFKNFVSFGMTLHIFDILLKVGNTNVRPLCPLSYIVSHSIDVLHSRGC